MRLPTGLLLLAATGCGGTGTDPNQEPAADLVAGAAYELVAVDDQSPPWSIVVPARAGTSTMTVGRGTLVFRSPFTPDEYEFGLYPEADPGGSGMRLAAGWRQTLDGWVELIGGGTTDDGQVVRFVEGRGRPVRGMLSLGTTTGFLFGAHKWTWRRVE